ncbi:MAG: Asp-tRNA(Asn)/Glu-tRNA(Gln) amidotransferase subunit GatB [Candidatus Diapherotrites archaeon]|nr:Asp-tRNA(Asn)/Glu-tRNA(Gln) amidotransferase subunit GatB [Candidatus Diapherotrites archaeon]
MVRIGFEIHVQLKTKSKLFCTCPTNFLDVEPNTNVCPVCTAQPGSKPNGINEEVIRKAVLVALALNCKIRTEPIRFMRKHYFYPDLPSNYQRTSEPFAVDGELAGVRIREIHIEEDPGRYELRDGTVDYNRSGVPLIEIVTEPDMTSVEEARDFLKHLRAVLDYLDVILYPQIGFRVDANVSIEGGERVEVKNINSIHGVVRALKYEIARHKRMLAMGKKITRETRHWDEVRGVTVSLREKETAEDYRYMPDPDIPPYHIDPALVEQLRAQMPELPHQKKDRLVSEYGIDESAAWTFVLDKGLGDLFESLADRVGVKNATAFCLNLRGELNYRNKYLSDIQKPERLESLADLYFSGKITKPVYVDYLRKVLDDPTFVPKAQELLSEDEIRAIAREIIAANPDAVADYRNGEKKALNFLVGQIVAKTKGKADPKKAIQILRGELNR